MNNQARTMPGHPAIFTLLLVAGLCAAPVALAGGECPYPYDDVSIECDANGANDICRELSESATEWRMDCDLKRNAEASGNQEGEAYAIYGEPSAGDACSGYDYCVFGVDTRGNDFCCAFDGTFGGDDLIKVALRGTDDSTADVLELQFGSYDMDHWQASHMEGVIFAGAGPDEVKGSRVDDADNYQDKLWGGEGDDVIYGYAGNDGINGDEGADTLYGGDGEDEIVGGIGNDWIEGGDDIDTLYGRTGDDTIIGNAGDDTLEGEGGADLLCGGADDDVLDGGTHNDILWGATSGDTDNGGAGTDSCDENATWVLCENTLYDPADKPANCP